MIGTILGGPRAGGRHMIFLLGALLISLALVAALSAGPASAGAFLGTNGKIAFTSNRDGNDEIYTMIPGDTGAPTQLTHTVYPSDNETPAFSADGTRIVFERNKEVWIMNADGTGQRQLTTDPAFDHDPTFSPNGKKIAFLTRRGVDSPPGVDNIWLMNANGSQQTRLTSGSSVSEPTWSPDGTRIAFVKGAVVGTSGQLWVIDPASPGAGTQYTFSNTGNVDTSVGVVTSPTFSPNGSLIEFRATGGALHCSCTGYFTVSSGGGNPNLLGASNPSDAGFAFSPDGTKVALQSTNRESNLEVYTMNPDGSGVVNITNDLSFVDKQPDWGPQVTRQSTTLSLSARPQSISSGQHATLSGKLATTSGEVYAGQEIIVEHKPKGTTSFRPFDTLRTDFGGRYKLSVKPRKTTTYRVIYNGNTALGLDASTSPGASVKVN